MALIASLSVCNTKSLYGLCVSVIVCLLCTVGYIRQYEPLSMEAECWACCGEINDRGRWQIVESEISLMQKSLQQHRPYTKYALLQEHALDQGRRKIPTTTLICLIGG